MLGMPEEPDADLEGPAQTEIWEFHERQVRAGGRPSRERADGGDARCLPSTGVVPRDGHREALALLETYRRWTESNVQDWVGR